MTTTRLRQEIGMQPDPDFDLELPPGWTRREVDPAVLDTMLAGVKRRFMAEHRPDLYVEVKVMLQNSFKDMDRNGVFAFFSPTEAGDGTLAIPASIHASIRRAGAGENLDDLARSLIRSHGATPLLGDPGTLRFELEKSVRLGTETIMNHAIIYLTPIPGAKRRRALQLVAGFGRTMDTPSTHPSLDAMRLLFDSCVSTLRWRQPAHS
ncbi:hypothetical protein GCM10023169_31640 [Georgenia halophila]|uniref:Uncharacterized protein n=1 Tax=Georgenia halophila TaxID=620889 RepID=A0ABP8LGQ1_9MICO